MFTALALATSPVAESRANGLRESPRHANNTAAAVRRIVPRARIVAPGAAFAPSALTNHRPPITNHQSLTSHAENSSHLFLNASLQYRGRTGDFVVHRRPYVARDPPSHRVWQDDRHSICRKYGAEWTAHGDGQAQLRGALRRGANRGQAGQRAHLSDPAFRHHGRPRAANQPHALS